jgi:hypothetical protein
MAHAINIEELIRGRTVESERLESSRCDAYDLCIRK